MATKTFTGIPDKDIITKLWAKIKSKFVAQETGKGLSSNDFTNAYKNKVDGAYSKPSTGIPETDLSQDVKNKLNNTKSEVEYLYLSDNPSVSSIKDANLSGKIVILDDGGDVYYLAESVKYAGLDTVVFMGIFDEEVKILSKKTGDASFTSKSMYYMTEAEAKTLLGNCDVNIATSGKSIKAKSSDGSFIEFTGVDNSANPNRIYSSKYLNIGSLGVQLLNQAWNAFVPIWASAFNQASSIRYKENIKTDVDGDVILKLNPVSFDYKNQTNMTRSYGFIAEEVAEIIDYPVSYKNGIIEGLDYSKFVPFLVKTCQNQQKEIDSLEKRIAELESKIGG